MPGRLVTIEGLDGAGKTTLAAALAEALAARGIDVEPLRERVRALNRIATCDLVPDRTLLLALDPGTGRERLAGRGHGRDRLEAEDAAFFARVAEAYAELAREEPERIRVID